MLPHDDTRPDPDLLLQLLKKEKEKEKKGKLKIFFGMCAGVGKTYDMLRDAHEAKRKGIDIVVGYIETHKRPETEALLGDLTVIPRRVSDYRGTRIEEMDLDAVLARAPRLVLVDELAHTNAPGSRHAKRYQDVLELLENGIGVYTTLNVQHLESRADAVAQITGGIVRETVPDSIFEAADEVEIIDISPDELLKRLAEGKVYTPERSQRAIENFFRMGNLTALREMSLRMTAERVDRQLREYMQKQRISGPWKSGQRLLVAIGASPHSVALIRWARRLAYTMDASWVAVYVESSQALTAVERDQLAKNIKLARELGAEIVSTADEDIAGALVRTAREQNATQILVGKPKHRLFSRAANLVEELMARSQNLDVYIVGHEEDEEERERSSPMMPGLQSRLPHYLFAVAIVLAAALACFPLTGYIGYRAVSLIILLAVAVLPLRLGPGPVLAAAAVGAMAWDFLFIPPRYTFSVSSVEDVMMLGLYFIVATVTGTLSAQVRSRERAVRQREERTSALYSLTRDLSSAHSQDEVVQAAVKNLKKYFNAEVAMLLSDTDGDVPSRAHEAGSLPMDGKEMSVAAWTYWNEKKAGRHTDTLPSSAATYFPLVGPRYPLGVIGVRLPQDAKLSIDQEVLLDNFISQISSAVERELLSEVTKKSIVVAESERLYKTLFSSISHELRTPIAAIIGASESLRSELSRATPSGVQYAEEIDIAAQRLNRLVANLLDMTRIESGMIRPHKDWCDIRDLVNSAVRDLSAELGARHLTIETKPSMPLVMLDFGLVEQALTNLIHNAVIHAPAAANVFISAAMEGTECVLSVADDGPGLPPDVLNHVFEKFYRAPGARTGGTGLGLPIARGFVEAHGGTLSARNRVTGGAEFIIRLPAGEQPSAAGSGA